LDALTTATDHVSSLVNAGRVVEAARAAAMYGPTRPPYIDRLARANSMGSGGRVSDAFAKVAAELTCSSSPYACKPQKMKQVMARWRPDFSGYAQHDAHEFLAALLDGLHEDQNLVRERRRNLERRWQAREAQRLDMEAAAAAAAAAVLAPASPVAELLAPQTPGTATASPRSEEEEAAVPAHTRVEELLGGKFASELICDECSHRSVTHEPFVCVSLPLRKALGAPPPRRVSVRIERSVLSNSTRRTTFESVLVRRDAPISELLHAAAAAHGKVRWQHLVLADVWQNKVHRFFCATDPVDEVTSQDDVVAYEVRDPQAFYPWTARQPVWLRRLCVPYQDRVDGYHAREDARKTNVLLASAVFNVGGTYYGEYNCSKEARACRFEVTGCTLLEPSVDDVVDEKKCVDSEDERERKPPPPRSLLPCARIKIIFDFITGNGGQGAYSCEGTYDSTTQEARVHPIRWIKKPDKNAVTMVPMTLRVAGGDHTGNPRLVGCVDQCGTAVVWAWSERDDQLEGNPWQQDTEEVDSDADPPRQDEVARPSASIGMVLYHRLAEEDDQGYHRQRQPLRGTPTLFTLPRYNEHGLETYRERATYKYLYETCTRYAPEPYHPAAHRDPPLQQPYQPRSSSHFPPPYQIPARRPDNYQVRGRGSRHRRRRIQHETDDDEESQRSDAADVNSLDDQSGGFDPNARYNERYKRSPTPARESWNDRDAWSPQRDANTYGSGRRYDDAPQPDAEAERRERDWDDRHVYGEFDSGLKGGSSGYDYGRSASPVDARDPEPPRGRRRKKTTPLITGGTNYAEEDRYSTKRYRYGNADDADDDLSSSRSRSPSPQDNRRYYDPPLPLPRAPCLFFRTDKDGRYLNDDRMKCWTDTDADALSSEEEAEDPYAPNTWGYSSNWHERRKRWGEDPLVPARRDAPCQPCVEYLRCEWRDVQHCDLIAGNPDGARDRVEALARDAQRGPERHETPLTVDRLLKLFACRERLDAADAWRCPGCETRVRAVKRLRLAAPNPPVLVLHLKRFEMLGYHSAKLETPVTVPSNVAIDIGPYICAPEEEDDETPSTRYYLCAVVNHFGTIEFGHYTAYARSRDDGCWRLFNDATVGVRDDDEVSAPSRAPYLLFLLREDAAPAEWVRQGKLREAAAATAAADTDSYAPAPAPTIPPLESAV